MEKLIQDKDNLINTLSQISGLSFLEEVDDDIIDDILMDWGESAQNLENNAIEIEGDPGKTEGMDTIKRILHTLKGDCAVFGLYKASDIFHEVENLLERYLQKGACPSEMLLQIVDWLHKILDRIEQGDIHIEDQQSREEPVQDQSQAQSQPLTREASRDSTAPEPVQDMEKAGLKTLVVDDDFTNRLVLQSLLGPYGQSHVAVNGKEAVEAVLAAYKTNEPYDLVCLDIMMPEMDGQEALSLIREEEDKSGVEPGKGVKIFMTTALDDSKNIMESFKKQCDGYLVKPISKAKIIEQLEKFSLIKS